MDFVKDLNPKPIYLAAELGLMPDYVGDAAQLTSEDLAPLQKVAFADPGRREFPIHSKTATWLSAAYAMGIGMTDPALLERITKAAAVFGITEDVTKLEAAFQAQIKTASAPERRYALVHEGEGYFPINDAEEILESGRAIAKAARHRDLPILLARQSAMTLVKAARAAGIAEDLLPGIRALGTDRLPNFDFAEVALGLRKAAGVTAEAMTLYRDLLDSAKSASAEEMDQFVALWADMDQANGLSYARGIPDPYASFYQDGEEAPDIDKLAAENVVIDDVMVPIMAIPVVSEDTVRKHFTKDAAEAIIGAQKITGTDPALATEAFAKLAAEDRRSFLGLLAAA